MLTFLVNIGLQWWAFWYPGAEPGGGGYIAQRIFSAKDEKQRSAVRALVQRRALRVASLALDSDRAGGGRSVSRTWNIRKRDTCWW